MDNLQIIYLPNTKDLKKHYWVYIHTCPNMKVYVGITHSDNPQYRWGKAGIRYKNQSHFYNAIQKYGWNNILHEAWEIESEEQMYAMEIWLINFFESNNKGYGYNKSIGGEHICDMGKNSLSREYQKTYHQSENQKEYQRQYYQEHRDELINRSHQYYHDNKENRRQYCQDHKDEIRKKTKIYHRIYQRKYQKSEKQKEYQQEYQRQYYKDNKTKLQEYYKQYYLKKKTQTTADK